MDYSEYGVHPGVPVEQQAEIAGDQVTITADMSDRNFLKYTLESIDVIKDIYYYLKGYDYDPNEQEYQKLSNRQLVNDQGIEVFLSIIRSHLNKNIYLSKLPNRSTAVNRQEKSNIIYRIMRDIHLNVVFQIYTNWENFDMTIKKPIIKTFIEPRKFKVDGKEVIKNVPVKKVKYITTEDPDIALFDTILNMITHNVFAALMRASGGFERINLGRSYQQQEKPVMPQLKESKGFFN